MRFGMVIDVSRCIGCATCAVACKSNNNLPNDMWWIDIRTEGGDAPDSASGTYPNNLHRRYFPVSCQHCQKPTCVAVCPTGATYKDADTGIVMTNATECIGCDSCVEGCPYGVRKLYGTDVTWSVDFAVGDSDAPTHAAGTVGKCTGCANRLARDEEPACMKLCPARARYWGDLDDPDSAASKYLASKSNVERLLESAGTEPNVYYVS